MAISVDGIDVLVRVSFSNDADPDFKAQAVFLSSDWTGWTPAQKALRLIARYQEWANARVPVDPAVALQQAIDALKSAAHARWQLERDLNLTATVAPDGTVTIT